MATNGDTTTSPSADAKKEKELEIDSQVVTLPLARVRTIMKSSPDVSNISQESLFLIAKSTELFIHHLTKKALDRSPDKNNVEYRALADFVNGEDTMQFLQVAALGKIDKDVKGHIACALPLSKFSIQRLSLTKFASFFFLFSPGYHPTQDQVWRLLENDGRRQ